MSNIPYEDRDQLVTLTPEQCNPGLTKPTDFTIGGQTKERIAELEAVDEPNKPIPDRAEVPVSKWPCPKQ
jgi:hypothetical protein